MDITHINDEKLNKEPRAILFDKDGYDALVPIYDAEAFFIQKPSAKEYFDTCNEFRWLSVYVTKGLCRRELYYAKYAYDVLLMEMFIKMLNWKVASAEQMKDIITETITRELLPYAPPALKELRTQIAVAKVFTIYETNKEESRMLND